MRAYSQIEPGRTTQRELRDVLGQFATGVTIVTAMTDTGPIAMTANSFSSVSMDPPLVLWCPAKSSLRYPHFVKAQHYAIHVLGCDQGELASRFAKTGADFDGVDWDVSEMNVPMLSDCLARFECSQNQIHEAGDHAIIVGEVNTALRRDGDALLFWKGKFGGFSEA